MVKVTVDPQRFKDILQEKHRTQKSLAEEIGWSLWTINDALRQKKMTLRLASIICKTLKIELNDFAVREEE